MHSVYVIKNNYGVYLKRYMIEINCNNFHYFKLTISIVFFSSPDNLGGLSSPSEKSKIF